MTYTSIGYFVVLAYERFTSVTYPFKYIQTFSKPGRKFFCLLAPGFFGLIMALPPLLGWSRYGLKTAEGRSGYCRLDFRDRSWTSVSYFVFISILTLLLPLTFTFTCFTRIVLDLRGQTMKNRRNFGKNSLISHTSLQMCRQQVLCTVLVTCVYLLSWLPHCVLCVSYYCGFEVWGSAETTAVMMSKSSTVTSPIIYCFIEKPFRRFVRKHLVSTPQPVMV